MRTFKFLLLSIIVVLSISCSKDEPTKPTIYGKWEYYQAGDHSTDKAISLSNRDYPGNVPGCKKDYLYFLHDKTVLHGDFYVDCQLDIDFGKWEEHAAILTLNNLNDSGDYRIEFMDLYTLKLTFVGYHPDNKASNFFIFKRAPLEL